MSEKKLPYAIVNIEDACECRFFTDDVCGKKNCKKNLSTESNRWNGHECIPVKSGPMVNEKGESVIRYRRMAFFDECGFCYKKLDEQSMSNKL